MVNRFLARAAPGIAELQPYVPGKPISELERELGINHSIKLASNENPLGPGPMARAAIAAALDELSFMLRPGFLPSVPARNTTAPEHTALARTDSP